jgi:predicted dithiol-disulfide oxidoreductase (DUF899 family)
MVTHDVVSKEQWLKASRELLIEEKAWTRERDRLAQRRRALPIAPKGRDEPSKGNLSEWVKRHDRYENDGRAR